MALDEFYVFIHFTPEYCKEYFHHPIKFPHTLARLCTSLGTIWKQDFSCSHPG